MPTVTDYVEKNSTLPKPLVFSLACLIEYYKTNDVQDDKTAVDFIKDNGVFEILANERLWGRDLSDFSEFVNESLDKIHKDTVREAMKWALL